MIFSFLIAFVVLLVASARADKGATSDPHSDYRQDFSEFDLDRNGQIDAQELRTLYGQTLSEKELHNFFNSVDTKGVGTFNMDDYVARAVR